jgi:hypothetical protein
MGWVKIVELILTVTDIEIDPYDKVRFTFRLSDNKITISICLDWMESSSLRLLEWL